MPGRLFESLSENSTSGEDTIPTRIPGIRLPGRIPGILVLRGHSITELSPLVLESGGCLPAGPTHAGGTS